jgi:hypothetical protein
VSAREWIVFPDPADPQHEIRADLTWLLSTWSCIFGRGCRGINAERPGDACCTHGAYFVDADDEKRVKRYAKRLTPETWERHGTRSLVVTDELDGEPARKTRVVDEVCVFFNRAPGPDYGCSLHHLAEREGLSILETKPEVCWQVPVRREWEDLGDERSRTTLTEFSRAAWGEGGADLSWWCSASASAHSGGADSTHDGLEAADVPGRSTPMVHTYEEELRALIGDSAYEELDRLCELRLSQGGTIVPLPLVEP